MRTDKLSYNDVATWFTRARNPEKGKPLNGWARMFKVGDTYELRHGGTRIGFFSPGNKFTFTMNTRQARSSSITLSQALQRAIPFLWYRKSTGRYVIKPTPQWGEFRKNQPAVDVYPYQFFKDVEGYEVFDGLCFDLNTYEPINARPSISAVVNKDKRTEWLRALRGFKRAVKVRAKLGIVHTLIQEVAQERSTKKSRYDWDAPDWNTEVWLDVLYESIRDSECSIALLRGIVKSTPASYYRPSTSVAEVLKECDRVCTTYSVDIRRKFGVFDGDTSEVPSV